MNQKFIWEKEYKNPQLITGGTEPQEDFKRFVKWLKKDRKLSLEGLRVLDLGSGTGKNSIFLAERGASVVGMEISGNAIKIAKERAKEVQLSRDVITFLHYDIGDIYPFENNKFDLVLDVISSNSLDEKGRSVYLKEVARVLKPGGYFFVRALCKDSDKNAEKLLLKNPGPEKDTYIIPELGLLERVFSKDDFVDLYSKNFTILNLLEKTGYSKFKDRIYKRNYLLAYMTK